MLKVKSIDVSYGDLPILSDVSLDVGERSIVALLGPNGAGKTTTLKTILGMLRPIKGEITFRGQSITHNFQWVSGDPDRNSNDKLDDLRLRSNIFKG